MFTNCKTTNDQFSKKVKISQNLAIKSKIVCIDEHYSKRRCVLGANKPDDATPARLLGG